MYEALYNAKRLVERIRFSGDSYIIDQNIQVIKLQSLKEQIYLTELKISPEVTPKLNKSLYSVCDKLEIPPALLECFVFSSPFVVAECYADSNSCILRFSSTLIELLDEHEFEFVVGHELGHYLFGHGITRMQKNFKSLEHARQYRYQEISADRVGLIACESLDIAIRAMVKTTSGLSNQHLRFDIGSYISQLKNASSSHDLGASHPSMIIRCRSLLWFSMHNIYTKRNHKSEKICTRDLDDRILKDFKKFIDTYTEKIIQQAKADVALWINASKIIDHGAFTKEMQKDFLNQFGNEILKSMKNYLSGYSPTEAKKEIRKRLSASIKKLEELLPDSYTYEVKKIEKALDDELKKNCIQR